MARAASTVKPPKKGAAVHRTPAEQKRRNDNNQAAAKHRERTKKAVEEGLVNKALVEELRKELAASQAKNDQLEQQNHSAIQWLLEHPCSTSREYRYQMWKALYSSYHGAPHFQPQPAPVTWQDSAPFGCAANCSDQHAVPFQEVQQQPMTAMPAVVAAQPVVPRPSDLGMRRRTYPDWRTLIDTSNTGYTPTPTTVARAMSIVDLDTLKTPTFTLAGALPVFEVRTPTAAPAHSGHTPGGLAHLASPFDLRTPVFLRHVDAFPVRPEYGAASVDQNTPPAPEYQPL